MENLKVSSAVLMLRVRQHRHAERADTLRLRRSRVMDIYGITFTPNALVRSSVTCQVFIMTANPFRSLPAVNQVLEVPALAAMTGIHAHDPIVEAIRNELADARQCIAAGSALDGQI